MVQLPKKIFGFLLGLSWLAQLVSLLINGNSCWSPCSRFPQISQSRRLAQKKHSPFRLLKNNVSDICPQHGLTLFQAFPKEQFWAGF